MRSLPIILVLGQALASSASFGGVQETRGVAAVDSEPAPQETGRFIIATIGIDQYEYWPKLDNAVQDAVGTAAVLIEKFGFEAPLPPLLDADATKENIEEFVEDRLRVTLEEDDNLVLLFAGHGHTRVDSIGAVEQEKGFIVPVDAQVGAQEKWSQYIDIESFLKEIGALPARHILVLLDSCHSGFALSGTHAKGRASLSRYESSLQTKLSRRVVTSARRDEEALDSGPVAGHSLFTGSLVDGLDRSLADLDDSEFITSSEIGLYLQQAVGRHSDSKQTPDYGSFHLDDRGEMVIPIALGSTENSLQRRAFSALKRGQFDTVGDLVNRLEGMGAVGPKLDYLQYRIDIANSNVDGAHQAISDINDAFWPAGTLPLSDYDVEQLLVRLRYWWEILTLSESAFPLEVTFLAKTSRDAEFEAREVITDDEFRGFEINTGEFFMLEFENPTADTWHVYMMDIDQDGRIEPVPLWDSDIQFDGLPAGTVARSYGFKHGGSLAGVSELRLFASKRRIRQLMSPPSTAARGMLEPLESSAVQDIKVTSVVYRAIAPLEIGPL